jgi:hypothetical protein
MRRARSGRIAVESHSGGMSACVRNGHGVSGQCPDVVEMVF